MLFDFGQRLQLSVSIVLLDYRLDGELGTDWLPRFKAVAPHLPVLMLTGQTDTVTDRLALSLGAADYLVKGDFSASGLQRALYSSIKREAALDTLTQSEEYHRHLFEDHPSACMVYDAQNLNIFVANQASTKLYGPDLAHRAFNELFAEPSQDWPLCQPQRRADAGAGIDTLEQGETGFT